MALPSSGAISMNQMHVEVGGTSGTTVGLNDSDIRALISKSSGATMSFNEWYGASATDNTFNGVKNTGTVSSGKISTTYHGVGTSTNGALTNGGINPPSGAEIRALRMSLGAAGENQEVVLLLASGVSSASSFSTYTGYRYIKVGSAIYFDSNVATSTHFSGSASITYSLTFNNNSNTGITKFNSISNGTSLSFTLSN